MQRAHGLDDYLQAPIGRYLVGDCFLHWCAAADLCGYVAWGRPGEAETRRLLPVLDMELPPAPPHASLVDLRRVEGIDAGAFEAMKEYMQQNEARFARSVTRQVLLRPDGLAGAIVGGFYGLLRCAYPHTVLTDPAEGLAWLGQPDAVAAPLLARLTELVAEATGQSPLLRELHQVMRAKLPDVTLSGVARGMGLSERTLQRRLKEASTSFQAELNAVQVRTARALLLETDMKLTAVAVEVGCASLQHFSSLFRKLVGESPSVWREHQRGRAAGTKAAPAASARASREGDGHTEP